MANSELDLSSGVPLYRQIKDILLAEITGGLADPHKPMTEEQLLSRFEVSRAPIRQALKELAGEGYVYRKQGKGTFPVPGARVRRPADVRPTSGRGLCTSTSPRAACTPRRRCPASNGRSRPPGSGTAWRSGRMSGSCISPG
ncbi:GntR family transcriptional regulator [Nonomuraea zeae]